MKLIRGRELDEEFFEPREIEEELAVKKIIRDVRQNRDDALKQYTSIFDGVKLDRLKIEHSEIENACQKMDKTLISSIKSACRNIRGFAGRQMEQFKDFEFELVPGVFTGQKVVPIERVGVYVPGGRFPLISTLLMCAIPAKVAGVKEIAVCSPPSCNSSIHPAILVAAKIVGVEEVYRVGGVQAIAALSYGTETIRKVDKIVGPGSRYVALAKKEVFGNVGIDFIAGPSEIMIIADETAEPSIVAADLLAQAEHDIDSVLILLTTSSGLAKDVRKELRLQLRGLVTKETTEKALEMNGLIILVEDLNEAMQIANRKAPEHLELHVKNPNRYIHRLRNYGTLFIGPYSAVALGDYSSGLNHVLPTDTCARYTGGLSVKDFLKFQMTLRVTEKGLKSIGVVAENLAKAEGLEGHAKSLRIRTKGKQKHSCKMMAMALDSTALDQYINIKKH